MDLMRMMMTMMKNMHCPLQPDYEGELRTERKKAKNENKCMCACVNFNTVDMMYVYHIGTFVRAWSVCEFVIVPCIQNKKKEVKILLLL
jgi:hypothetical protein